MKESRGAHRKKGIMNRVTLEGIFIFVISFHCLFVVQFLSSSKYGEEARQGVVEAFSLSTLWPENIILCRSFQFTFSNFNFLSVHAFRVQIRAQAACSLDAKFSFNLREGRRKLLQLSKNIINKFCDVLKTC
jgi:hypothetical protein